MVDIKLDKDFDIGLLEDNCRKLWEDEGIYKYDREDQEREIFSVDTPPPYASASHLHVGHAMSYTQAEFVVRYQRMKGKNVFYPMGFDDNGLPTERHVEKEYKVNKKNITRKEFRDLCLKETKRCTKIYEEIWRKLGVSVDWSLLYSTIDEHSQRTAQKSFLDLYEKGYIYRANEPVLWDTHFSSSLAQADLETIERKGTLYDVAFKSAQNGQELIISTTRPELLPACVALYFNPNDERYKKLKDTKAVIPYFGGEVPIKTSDEVDKDFGTGLMMVCTFGDGEDVKKWKEDGLDTKILITKDGKLNELAGEFSGLPVIEAKSKIAKKLEEEGFIRDKKSINQVVSIGERSEIPVEFVMHPQWFVDILKNKDSWHKRGEEINWFPEFMKVRLDNWIEGLKYNWSISRQRFYGVPIPVWKCSKCGEYILPKEKDLPVDPSEEKPPVDECPKCGSKEIIGENDVFDTWFTSSLTPLINANWAETPNNFGDSRVYPMSLRTQGHDIIRTWLFYTLIKSHLHTNSLPWKDVMISGHGQNEQGKKISKRHMHKYTDPKTGYNRYNPLEVMKKFGADSFRYWAASAKLGSDVRFNEKDVKSGRKLVIKLWNATRFALMHLENFNPDKYEKGKNDYIEIKNRTLEDRWMLKELNEAVKKATNCFEKYDYAGAKDLADKFFWTVYCDNYLEIIKDRFINKDKYTDEIRLSAEISLWESIRVLLSLFAPFIPYITEELFQKIYQKREGVKSLHISKWPEYDEKSDTDVSDMKIILNTLTEIRGMRSDLKISQGAYLEKIVVDIKETPKGILDLIKKYEKEICAAARVEKLSFTEENFEYKIKLG